jgi:hypothetical protein
MCDQREVLMDYLFDEASPAVRQQVEHHLETCDACRTEIRQFRQVRQDLLAWDVPEYTSVFTPFAPAEVRPWYRQVPAWTMAAAASVMFVLGTAGGFAAQSLMGTRVTTAAANPAVPPPPVTAMAPAGDMGLDEATVRQLIAGSVADVEGRLMTRVSQRAPGLDPKIREAILGDAAVLVRDSHAQQWDLLERYVNEVQRERARERRDYEQTVGNLRDRVAGLEQTVVNLLQQGSKGQQQ